MGKSSKGSSFERWFCRELSLWWTKGENDSVFWRTSNSGGRATVRDKKGQKTKNQYGDICAIDPIGQPLLNFFTMELKRGYSKHTIADLLDSSLRSAKQVYQKWIDQAKRSQEQAGSRSWILVVQRDRRRAIVIIPSELMDLLDVVTSEFIHYHNPDKDSVFVIPFDDFLGAFGQKTLEKVLQNEKCST